jgi:hypothetical protein
MPLDTTNQTTPAPGKHLVPLLAEANVHNTSFLSPASTPLVEEPKSQETIPSPPVSVGLSRSGEERQGVTGRRRARERTLSAATSDGLPDLTAHETQRRRGSYLSTTTTISTISNATSGIGSITPDCTRSLYSPSVNQAKPIPPPGLAELLDGEHHTDELCTMLKIGWPVLKKYMAVIGNPDLDLRGGIKYDLGRVKIIYR